MGGKHPSPPPSAVPGEKIPVVLGLKDIILCLSNTQLQAFNSAMAIYAQNVTFVVMIIDSKILYFTSFI